MKNTEREGVSAAQSIVYKDLGWFFTEQMVNDYGIDAIIEVAGQKYPTGKVIAVQIKSGASYFINTTKEGVTFRFDERHKRYWLRYSDPVIVLLYHPDTQECIWEVVDKYTVKKVSDKGYKIVIPKDKQFGLPTKEKLLVLAYSNKIADLAEDIEDLDVDTDTVFSILDDKQKNIFLKTRIVVDKKNASSDKIPFEFNKDELSDFVSVFKWFDKKNDLFMGKQFINLICQLESFIDSNEDKPFIILT